jgi:hypothetical protein
VTVACGSEAFTMWQTAGRRRSMSGCLPAMQERLPMALWSSRSRKVDTRNVAIAPRRRLVHVRSVLDRFWHGR